MKSAKLTVQTTIFLVSDDPQQVIALVTYTDGRVGIVRNGQAVGNPWTLRDLPCCVAMFQELARPPTSEKVCTAGQSALTAVGVPQR